MYFEELWESVWKGLPSEAKELLPKSLSDSTKANLIESGKSPTENAKIIGKVVDEINQGSVESIDTMVKSAILGE